MQFASCFDGHCCLPSREKGGDDRLDQHPRIRNPAPCLAAGGQRALVVDLRRLAACMAPTIAVWASSA